MRAYDLKRYKKCERNYLSWSKFDDGASGQEYLEVCELQWWNSRSGLFRATRSSLLNRFSLFPLPLNPTPGQAGTEQPCFGIAFSIDPDALPLTPIKYTSQSSLSREKSS